MTEPNGSTASLFKNAASQIGGRLFLSLGRLGAALLIVRMIGTDRFGAYALVLNFVTLFEWLCDFGQTDIAVREICQRPGQTATVLGALVRLKLMMGVGFALLLPVMLAVLQYPAEIVRAGAVSGVSVLCYAMVQLFRTHFKVAMCMERDVGAELVGLLVMLPLTWWACRTGAGVDVLVGCYAVGRIVFLGLGLVFAGGVRDRLWHVSTAVEIRRLAWQSAPLGFMGLLVSVYDSLATVILSKLTDMSAVAEYAAATRFVFPVIIIVQSLSSAFYPPLAAQWRVSSARLRALQQTALEISVLVGGGLFSGIFGGADFLMGLMGPQIGAASPVLRLMTVVVLARAVTTAMSPLIVIAGRQTLGLWLTASSVVLQFFALLILVPRFGILGAVSGYLALELLLGVVPVSWLGQRAAGVRMNWSVPVRLLVCAFAAVVIAQLLPTRGGFFGGVIAGTLYLALALGSRTVSLRQARATVAEIAASRRAARAGGAAA